MVGMIGIGWYGVVFTLFKHLFLNVIYNHTNPYQPYTNLFFNGWYAESLDWWASWLMLVDSNRCKKTALKGCSFLTVVRTERLELSHLAAPEPKSGASTNFATSAKK